MRRIGPRGDSAPYMADAASAMRVGVTRFGELHNVASGKRAESRFIFRATIFKPSVVPIPESDHERLPQETHARAGQPGLPGAETPQPLPLPSNAYTIPHCGQTLQHPCHTTRYVTHTRAHGGTGPPNPLQQKGFRGPKESRPASKSIPPPLPPHSPCHHTTCADCRHPPEPLSEAPGSTLWASGPCGRPLARFDARPPYSASRPPQNAVKIGNFPLTVRGILPRLTWPYLAAIGLDMGVVAFGTLWLPERCVGPRPGAEPTSGRTRVGGPMPALAWAVGQPREVGGPLRPPASKPTGR